MATGANNAKHERVRAMTASFNDVVRERMEREPAFRDALRTEALAAIQAGDIEGGRSMLRKYFGEGHPDGNTVQVPAMAGLE
jgi:hypothetical protein